MQSNNLTADFKLLKEHFPTATGVQLQLDRNFLRVENDYAVTPAVGKLHVVQLDLGGKPWHDPMFQWWQHCHNQQVPEVSQLWESVVVTGGGIFNKNTWERWLIEFPHKKMSPV